MPAVFSLLMDSEDGGRGGRMGEGKEQDGEAKNGGKRSKKEQY